MCACFCSWAGAGFASRLFKPVVDFWCGLAAAATPNVVGEHTLQISRNSIVYWRGVEHCSLAVGNSRKVSEEPCLSDVYLKEDFLED